MQDSEKEMHLKDLFVSGHRACHGCGQALAVRHILKATGKNVIIVTPTGCLETFTLTYGYSAWNVPWIHHLFENGASIATGIAASLRAKKRSDTRVMVLGGDGGTFDIGFGALSGMLERGDDVLYICFDNGAYMNTGGQRSGATPEYASTSTHPVGRFSMGKPVKKKDLPAIVAAHRIPYVATSSAAYPKDIQRKVKKAMTFRGCRYIQIDSPCPSVWGFPSNQTLEVGRLGVRSGLIPLFEMENGEITNVKRIKERVPVTEYLKTQKRFRHLIPKEEAQKPAELKEIEAIAEYNISRFGLMDQSGRQ